MALDNVALLRDAAVMATAGMSDVMDCPALIDALIAAVREDERAATKERCRLAVGAVYLQGCSVGETRRRVQEAIRDA